MVLVALACLALAESPDDEIRGLRELRRSMREKQTESAALLRAAHEELDRAAYGSAVEKHRKAKALEAEREALRKTESDRLEKIARDLVRDLDQDAVETRDRASKLLIALGPGAIPILERLMPGPSEEVRYRLGDALAKLRMMEMDAEGLLHQWAATARASSEYTAADWSAARATGKPDTAAAGDARTAWASLAADAGEEWLELGYEHAVRPTRVRVRENFNPGAVIRVEARDAEGNWRALWQGKDPTREAPGWFEVPLTAGFETRAIRVTLDSAGVPGWNEIDAVELVGDPAP